MLFQDKVEQLCVRRNELAGRRSKAIQEFGEKSVEARIAGAKLVEISNAIDFLQDSTTAESYLGKY